MSRSAEWSAFFDKIGPAPVRRTTIRTTAGKPFVLREATAYDFLTVDRQSSLDDRDRLAKRVAAVIVTINSVEPTDIDRTLLAVFGGLEMDELVRAYAEAFDPDFVARYEQTRESIREWLKHQKWLEQGENNNE